MILRFVIFDSSDQNNEKLRNFAISSEFQAELSPITTPNLWVLLLPDLAFFSPTYYKT